jgi:hypothetical protein
MYDPIDQLVQQRHQDMLRDAEQWRQVRRARGAQQPRTHRDSLNAIIRNLLGLSAEPDQRPAARQPEYPALDMDSGVFPAV